MAFPVLTSKVSKKSLFIIGILLTCAIIIFVILTNIIFYESKIFPNIFIESVNVGGLTPKEAKNKVKDIFENEIESFNMELAYESNSWQLSYEDLGLYYIFDDYVAKAYGIARTGNYYERIKKISSLKRNPEIIKLEPYHDPSKIDNVVEKISKLVNKSPIDAKIERKNGNFIVIKEILGVELEKEVLKVRINEALKNFTNDPISIPVKEVKPKVTEQSLNTIQDLLAEYGTTFNSEVQGRSENIRLAVNSIDRTLLMPGEEFSFNESTGPRSVEEGYKEAPVIVNGELVPGIGGGICQVSTTLYQAVVRSDIEVVSRRNHGLPVGYVPIGQDATVAYDYIDFRFRNNKEYPIYVESYINGNQVFVKIHSKKTNNTIIDLQSEIVEVIEPNIEIKKDPTRYLGETKISKEAKKGYRVITYKVYFQEGKEFKREIISKDYYPPRDGVVLEGTKEL